VADLPFWRVTVSLLNSYEHYDKGEKHEGLEKKYFGAPFD